VREPRQHLSEEAASYVRSLVLSGQLAVGEYVRVGRIAEELEISHTPVREALSALRAEGFLELDRNRGFRVAETLPAGDLEDLYMVQAFVGGELCARAAERIDDDVLAELDRLCSDFEASAETDPEQLELLNREFHDAINDASESRALANFYARTVPISRHFYHLVPGWTKFSMQQHRAILEALRKHDPEAARTQMRTHTAGIAELVIDHLKSLDAGRGSTPEDGAAVDVKDRAGHKPGRS
jgi:DNA-binding GntR family transcriptional regulator